MTARSFLPAALLALAFVGACESSTDSGAATRTLSVQADSVVTALSTQKWTARLVDDDGEGIAGALVRFDVRYVGPDTTRGDYPWTSRVAVDSVITDAEGRAEVSGTLTYHGTVRVQAVVLVADGAYTVSSIVRVRPAVFVSRWSQAGHLDSLSFEGPQCSVGAEIVGSGSNEFGRSDNSITLTPENPEVLAITRVIGGGTYGLRARAVYPRVPGTTRIIATSNQGGAEDTVMVRVATVAQPLSILRRMQLNQPGTGAFLPDSVVVAVGDTAGVTIATDPLSCDAAVLPANYAVTFQSANTAVARIEALEEKRWTIQNIASPLSIGANLRLRAVAAGRTELVATAPYTASKRITVIVR